jgi:hypothetical protein
MNGVDSWKNRKIGDVLNKLTCRCVVGVGFSGI